MKKFLNIVLTVSLFLSIILPVQATDYYQLDERQLESNACATVYSGYYRNQTFKMDYNVLTKVSFEMNNRNGGSVTLTVKDEVTSDVVVTSTRRMGLGDGWEEFDLVGDALGYIVEPGRTYSIWVGTSYYSGEDVPCWRYTTTDQYSKGAMRQGSTESTGDFVFAIHGYEIDMGRENPEDPGDEEDGGEEETVIEVDEGTDEEDSGTQEEETDTGEDFSAPDQSKDSTEVEVEEDEEGSINPPVLGSVIVDDTLVELDDDDSVTVGEESVVKITGTADPGDNVAVIIEDKAYTATTDEDGNWYVIFHSSDFSEGSYSVQAQASNDGKGSEKVTLLTLSIGSTDQEDDVTVSVSTEEKDFLSFLSEGPVRYIICGVVALFFIGLAILILILIKRKKEDEEDGGKTEDLSKIKK